MQRNSAIPQRAILRAGNPFSPIGELRRHPFCRRDREDSHHRRRIRLENTFGQNNREACLHERRSIEMLGHVIVDVRPYGYYGEPCR